MRSWNYRVIRRKFTDSYSDYSEFTVHEVYYDHSGKVTAWTSNSVMPYGNSLNDLKEDLKMFEAAVKLPVLNWEDMPGEERRTSEVLAAD